MSTQLQNFMPNFAILRTKKLSTIGNVAGSGSHNYRERATLNADPRRTPKNQHIGANSTEGLIKRVQERLPDKVRKNAVRCIEYLITASPEAFNGGLKATDYFKDALRFLQAKHGKENVVAASIHNDETTPHLVVYVVPLDSDGKLNCRSFLGGRQKLSELQTEFAKAVGEAHGLQRGKQGSEADHKEIKQWYAEKAELSRSVDAVEAKPIPLTGKLGVAPADFGFLKQTAKKAQGDDQARKRARRAVEQAEAKVKRAEANANEKIESYGFLERELGKVNRELIKATAALLKSESKADLAKLMGVEIKGKEDIFDAVIRSTSAHDFDSAVIKVAMAYNKKHGTRISETAQWAVDYGNSDKPSNR